MKTHAISPVQQRRQHGSSGSSAGGSAEGDDDEVVGYIVWQEKSASTDASRAKFGLGGGLAAGRQNAQEYMSYYMHEVRVLGF
jgi:hypothetical protein